MGTLIRIPLRVLLPCLAVSLVTIGAVAAGIAGVSGTTGYLMRQADNNLLACARSMLSHGFEAPPSSGPVSSQAPPGPCDMELLSASGQVLTLAAPGTAYGPVIPAVGSWLAAHLARPVTDAHQNAGAATCESRGGGRGPSGRRPDVGAPG